MNLLISYRACLQEKETNRMSKEIQDEIFGLTPQVRRSGVSVANCIASALENGSEPVVHQLLNLSLRFSAELEYYLGIAKDQMYKPVVVENSNVEPVVALIESDKSDIKSEQH